MNLLKHMQYVSFHRLERAIGTSPLNEQPFLLYYWGLDSESKWSIEFIYTISLTISMQGVFIFNQHKIDPDVDIDIYTKGL